MALKWLCFFDSKILQELLCKGEQHHCKVCVLYKVVIMKI